jgi:hypothetical protein
MFEAVFPLSRQLRLHRIRIAAPRAGLLLMLLMCGGCGSAGQRTEPVVGALAQVQLQIDFNGRAENKQFHIDWKDNLTVFACLEELQREGKLTMASRGAGAETFLIAIDGLENSGGGGDNWVYYVNDRLGDASAGVSQLQPGDRVEWRYGAYAPK